MTFVHTHTHTHTHTHIYIYIYDIYIKEKDISLSGRLRIRQLNPQQMGKIFLIKRAVLDIT